MVVAACVSVTVTASLVIVTVSPLTVMVMVSVVGLADRVTVCVTSEMRSLACCQLLGPSFGCHGLGPHVPLKARGGNATVVLAPVQARGAGLSDGDRLCHGLGADIVRRREGVAAPQILARQDGGAGELQRCEQQQVARLETHPGS
jgi:hypothetical protein